MSRTRRLSSVLCCILGLAATIAPAKPDEKPHRIVVMIDHDSHGFIYTINSEKVQDLLLALSKRKEEPENEVILLVHNKVTLAMVNNIVGILSKAGYVAPPRVFVFDSYKNAMNELSFTYSPRIPFSATGDVPPKNFVHL
jgi:energy-converting hydrogenase Eha subunit C